MGAPKIYYVECYLVNFTSNRSFDALAGELSGHKSGPIAVVASIAVNLRSGRIAVYTTLNGQHE